MSHGITASDTMFSVGVTPWHKLGKVVALAPNIAEAIKLAGLDWGVLMVALQTVNGDVVDPSEARAVVRDDNRKILGITGGRYVPLQNRDVFAWFDPILAAGEATLETAGSLFEGRKVWALAKIGHNGDSKAEIVPGDTVINHWLLSNSHDATSSIRVGRVRTRVVCANTLAAALGENGTVRIRHTATATATLNDVRDLMRKEHDAFTKDVAAFRALAKVQVTSARLKEYVQAVFPDSFKEKKAEKPALNGRSYTPPRGTSIVDDLLGAEQPKPASDDFADQRAELASEIYDRIVELVEVGRGADIPGVRGTMWGAYNAIGEFLQYEHGRGPAGATEKRMANIAWGGAATANMLALQKAMEFGRVGS